MGNRWGAGKENGEGRGRGEVSLLATWDQNGQGVAPHAKEGFQVSKRDSGRGEGSSGKGRITKGIRQGVIKGIVPCALM